MPIVRHSASALASALRFGASAGFAHRPPSVTIVGAGLAGSEAAWQAAQAGAHVTLYEMRPGRMTPAHESGWMAELVCSNSLGSNLPDRALGLLKNEMRRLDSLIIACADRTAVPAGDALAVGREAFSQAVTEAIARHPHITVRAGGGDDPHPAPLSRPGRRAGGEGDPPPSSPPGRSPPRRWPRRFAISPGRTHLSFFDAMAPIVTAESVDMTIAWRGNRWQDWAPGGRGRRAGGEEQGAGASSDPSSSIGCAWRLHQLPAHSRRVLRLRRGGERGGEDRAARVRGGRGGAALFRGVPAHRGAGGAAIRRRWLSGR